MKVRTEATELQLEAAKSHKEVFYLIRKEGESGGLCLAEQVSPDVPGQMFVHLGVPGHGLASAGEGTQ